MQLRHGLVWVVLLLLDCQCLRGVEVLAVLLDIEEAAHLTHIGMQCHPLRWLVILIIS